eukprot:gene9647-12378_t
MTVMLKLNISEACEERFKTAVFRFIELYMSSVEQDMILTTTSCCEPDWFQADVEFSSPDLATRFRQFLGLRHPEVVMSLIQGMSKPPAIQDRAARRAQALRSNLRRRKASPEPV